MNYSRTVMSPAYGPTLDEMAHLTTQTGAPEPSPYYERRTPMCVPPLRLAARSLSPPNRLTPSAADANDEYITINAPKKPKTFGNKVEKFCVSCNGKLHYISDAATISVFHENVRTALSLTQHETFELYMDGRLDMLHSLRVPSNCGRCFSLNPVPWGITTLEESEFKFEGALESSNGMVMLQRGKLKNLPIMAQATRLVKPHVAIQFDNRTLDAHYDGMYRLATNWQKLLQHPHVLTLLRVYAADLALPQSGLNFPVFPVYFVSPLLTGSLEDEATRRSTTLAAALPLIDALPGVMHHIASGLLHLHQGGITHGDLRASTVLFTDFPHGVVLSSFGFSLGHRCSRRLWDTHVTGKHCIAPEVASREAEPSPISDTWGLGIVVLECLDILMHMDMVTNVSKICNQRLPLGCRQDELEIFLDRELSDLAVKIGYTALFSKENPFGSFVRMCLAVDPVDRLCATNAVKVLQPFAPVAHPDIK